LPPLEEGDQFARIAAHTRARYMVPREIVEGQIKRFFPKLAAKRPRYRTKRRDPDT
jgi:hypothetical protein